MSDLADVIADPDFATAGVGGDPGYLVTRRGAPTLVDGVATVGAVTTAFRTGPAILRPLSGKELQALPEGYRAENVRKLVTTADIRTIDETAGTPADTVTIVDASTGVSELWTAFRVAVTTAFGGTHRHVWVAKGAR